jgi:hypothetical protein
MYNPLVALLDPLVLLGLGLFLWKRTRPFWLLIFFIVAGLHLVVLSSNPIKNNFFYEFIAARLVYDGLFILEMGMFFNVAKKSD